MDGCSGHTPCVFSREPRSQSDCATLFLNSQLSWLHLVLRNACAGSDHPHAVQVTTDDQKQKGQKEGGRGAARPHLAGAPKGSHGSAPASWLGNQKLLCITTFYPFTFNLQMLLIQGRLS
jgi:hypothetical protein